MERQIAGLVLATQCEARTANKIFDAHTFSDTFNKYSFATTEIANQLNDLATLKSLSDQLGDF